MNQPKSASAPVGVHLRRCEHSEAEDEEREGDDAHVTNGRHSEPEFRPCHRRQAASYRERRVLLAGDSAHVHSPAGGQGLNIGVQDAVNLGWKLAQVVNETSPDSLLDTYQAERHPIGARVLKGTMAQTALNRGDERTNALRETLSELLKMDEPHKRYAAMMSGLDIRYDLGTGHPLLGRRMPDLDLATESGPRRVFTLLHDARPDSARRTRRVGWRRHGPRPP